MDDNKETMHTKVDETRSTVIADLMDEKACRHYLLDILHPDGPRCPVCQNKITDSTTLNNFYSGKRCICKKSKCGAGFKCYTKTILHGTQLEARQIVTLMVLAEFKDSTINTREIADNAKVSDDTVYQWLLKIKGMQN